MDNLTIAPISHPEVTRLAQELMRYTGETATDAMLNALRERLEREQRKQLAPPSLADQLLAFGRQCTALPMLDTRTPDEILGYNVH
jgi:antitoxin VapB